MPWDFAIPPATAWRRTTGKPQGGLKKPPAGGDVDAQVNLALLYAGPCNCAAHREKAVYWLTQAARQGDAQAAVCLAELTRDPSPFQ